jgi:3-phosphoshikimate 1-carboxyvinyltransferase
VIEIKPVNRCHAVFTLPGSKSFTHRALVVSALAKGESVLTHALRCEDTEHTVRGLEALGVPVFWEGTDLRVLGKAGELTGPGGKILVGNSGTSMRFLTALAALKKSPTMLDGSERMRQRPMGELLAGLESMGVRAYSQGADGCPPVIVESEGLLGGTATITGDKSSQFLSGLLMIAPYARHDVLINVAGPLASRSYVDMTLDVMASFGVKVRREGYESFSVKAGPRYSPRTYPVEGDASNASYFFSAAAVTRGKVRVENFPSTSVQGDTRFLEILERMGCEVVRGKGWTEVQGKELRGLEIDMNGMPDLVPTLAITAAFARGKTVIRRIGHLRLKESDRIRALATELTRMGIEIEEGEDWLGIEGGQPRGAEIETHDDHRLAMSFATAGLAASGVKILGEQCVNKSFPDFWETFGRFYS